jgi:hypothetical protein
METGSDVASSTPTVSASLRPGRRRRPSSGFVAVCATYVLAAAFLVWGFATPDLDRVWALHHELKIGKLGAPDTSCSAARCAATPSSPTRSCPVARSA